MNFIDEQQELWSYLSARTKPVVIYGMGNGAVKILAKCREYQIEVKAIFASDEFVRGQSFLGYKIIKYAEVIEQYGPDIIILLAFGAEKPPMLEHFAALAQKHELLAPNFPLFGERCFDNLFVEQYRKELSEAYEMLADAQSRRVFKNICNYKLSGKVEYLQAIATERVEDIQTLLNPGARETYMDLGAYNGDTVKEFLEITGGQYERIIAFEPDTKNFKKLAAWQLSSGLANVEIVNKGIWSGAGTLHFNNDGARSSAIDTTGKFCIAVEGVDNFLAGRPVSLIKMDVEGAEQQALDGARTTLGRYRPKLFVACYHREEDLFELPFKIRELNDSYRIYLRKHPYIPAWELNLFAV